MRVSWLASEVSIHTARWLRALTARGYDVQLMTMHPAPVAIERVRRCVLPFRGRAGYVLNAPLVRRWLAGRPTDVFHAHYASGYGTLGRLARPRARRVLSVWGSDVLLFGHASPLKRRLLHANLMAYDEVCATSEALKRGALGIAPSIRRVSVTPFGVDVRKFHPDRDAEREPAIRIGTVKRFAHIYGTDLLVRGFALARGQWPGARGRAAEEMKLVLVGGGPQEGEIRRLVKELGLADCVEIHGKLDHDQVPGMLRSFDIYAAVSRSESFGVGVLEASACGVPVVVSDVGGLPEVVIDNATGLVVRRGDVRGLADAILRLAADDDLRVRLGDGGRDFVRQRYDWEDSVDIMEAVYRRSGACRQGVGD